ncbi:MAG: hypothetical protein HOP29_16925 [Phycisphaerales bacterium]|nr:hypothetical protein [Phycisphaerales bacterium]
MNHRQIGIWLGAVLVISLISRWRVYQSRADRCNLDGNRIEPVRRVDLVRDGETVQSFCCIRCAGDWPDVPADAYWRVHDEITGEPLDASNACFVESRVVTVPSRRDRIHVFKNWADALGHCTQYEGHRIPNPFDPAAAQSNDPGSPK